MSIIDNSFNDMLTAYRTTKQEFYITSRGSYVGPLHRDGTEEKTPRLVSMEIDVSIHNRTPPSGKEVETTEGLSWYLPGEMA
jgi:hypothetical protein